MSDRPRTPARFGRITPPDEAWLSQGGGIMNQGILIATFDFARQP